MAATIRDVAVKAGVSPSTVSKALNDSGAVSEKTLDKIRRAVKELNYQPNARARSFATKSSQQVIFLADFPFDAAFVQPHLFEIMRGVQHSLDKNGYTMVMKNISSKEAAEYVASVWNQHAADGFVLHMSMMSKKLASFIVAANIPHIVIGKPNYSQRLCWIDTDNALSGEIAAHHLIECGYTDFLFIGGRTDDMISWRRLVGVRQALNEVGLNLPHERIIQTQSTLADGAKAAKKYLRMNPKPQAIICANNPLALGFMQTLQSKNVKIPDDAAVITFDSYPFSLLTEPQMTVVDINMYEMGQEAGRLVLQKLKHPTRQIQTYITTPELICRGTTISVNDA